MSETAFCLGGAGRLLERGDSGDRFVGERGCLGDLPCREAFFSPVDEDVGEHWPEVGLVGGAGDEGPERVERLAPDRFPLRRRRSVEPEDAGAFGEGQSADVVDVRIAGVLG